MKAKYNLLFVVILCCFSACENESVKRITKFKLNNAAVFDYDAAIISVSVIDLSEQPFSDAGFCVSHLNTEPTIADSKYKIRLLKKGTYTDTIQNLVQNTRYFTRFYLIEAGTVKYSNAVSFTLPQKPVLQISLPEQISYTSAIISGVVNANNNESEVFFEVLNENSPAIRFGATPKSITGNLETTVNLQLNNLTENTNYSYRLILLNNMSPVYSEPRSFKTLKYSVPKISTGIINNISQNSASVTLTIDSDGGLEILNTGVCWSVQPYPTQDDNNMLYTIMPIEMAITDLRAETTYYVRAYASNSVGLAYGNQRSFTTKNASMPSISAPYFNDENITQTTAKITCSVLSDGGADILERGFCWSSSGLPLVTDNKVLIPNTQELFEGTIQNLLPITGYNVRAFAINKAGLSYSTVKYFVTKPSK